MTSSFNNPSTGPHKDYPKVKLNEDCNTTVSDNPNPHETFDNKEHSNEGEVPIHNYQRSFQANNLRKNVVNKSKEKEAKPEDNSRIDNALHRLNEGLKAVTASTSLFKAVDHFTAP